MREGGGKYLTNLQSGERVVDDADQHPFSFHRVGSSIQEEAPRLLLGCFHQHISPVEVPVINSTEGIKVQLQGTIKSSITLTHAACVTELSI